MRDGIEISCARWGTNASILSTLIKKMSTCSLLNHLKILIFLCELANAVGRTVGRPIAHESGGVQNFGPTPGAGGAEGTASANNGNQR